MVKKLRPNLIKMPAGRHAGTVSYDRPHRRLPHEIEAVNRLLRFGHNITFIAEQPLRGIHTPDIFWQEKYWEIKTIMGSSTDTISRSIKEAKKQSLNIVIDAVHAPKTIDQILREIENEIKRSDKRLKVMVLLRDDYYCILKKSMLI
jgi:hypothetical protein